STAAKASTSASRVSTKSCSAIRKRRPACKASSPVWKQPSPSRNNSSVLHRPLRPAHNRAMARRHPENAAGDWYVDDACIDCMAARDVAPGLIVARGGQSVFARQPVTEDELLMAWRAR